MWHKGVTWLETGEGFREFRFVDSGCDGISVRLSETACLIRSLLSHTGSAPSSGTAAMESCAQ